MQQNVNRKGTYVNDGLLAAELTENNGTTDQQLVWLNFDAYHLVLCRSRQDLSVPISAIHSHTATRVAASKAVTKCKVAWKHQRLTFPLFQLFRPRHIQNWFGRKVESTRAKNDSAPLPRRHGVLQAKISVA
jgi:hypothetical protein